MKMKKQVIGILAIAVFGCISIASASRVTEIIQYHFQYWTNAGVKYESNETAKWDNADLWFILSQADNFLKENITKLLSNSEDRSSNFSRYLTDGIWLINALGYQKNSLNNELQSIARKIQLCENQLSTANQQYRSSLDNWNENGFYQAVEKAKKARSCLWEEYVSQNAVKTLLAHVQSYLTSVTRRVNYLKNNQSLILKHYDILKPSLLKELYPIAVQLENQSKAL